MGHKHFFKKLTSAALLLILPSMLSAGVVGSKQSNGEKTTQRAVSFATESSKLGAKQFTFRTKLGDSVSVYLNGIQQVTDNKGNVVASESALVFQFDDGEYCLLTAGKTADGESFLQGTKNLQRKLMSRPGFALLSSAMTRAVKLDGNPQPLAANSGGGGGGHEPTDPVGGDDDPPIIIPFDPNDWVGACSEFYDPFDDEDLIVEITDDMMDSVTTVEELAEKIYAALEQETEKNLVDLGLG